MSDYISREEAIKRINGICVTDDLHGMMIREGIEKAVKVIYRIPAADVALVVHGEWIEDESGYQICSNCGDEHYLDEYRATYCESCGARMDGGKR